MPEIGRLIILVVVVFTNLGGGQTGAWGSFANESVYSLGAVHFWVSLGFEISSLNQI